MSNSEKASLGVTAVAALITLFIALKNKGGSSNTVNNGGNITISNPGSPLNPLTYNVPPSRNLTLPSVAASGGSTPTGAGGCAGGCGGCSSGNTCGGLKLAPSPAAWDSGYLDSFNSNLLSIFQ